MKCPLGEGFKQDTNTAVVEMWFPFCLTPERGRRNWIMATMSPAWAVETVWLPWLNKDALGQVVCKIRAMSEQREDSSQSLSTVFWGKHEQSHSKPCADKTILSFTILPATMKPRELTLGSLGWCSWSLPMRYMCNCGLMMKKSAELFSSWKHSQQNSFSEENRAKCHSIGSPKTLGGKSPPLQPFQWTQQQREEQVKSPGTEVFLSCQGHRSPFSSHPSCLSQALITVHCCATPYQRDLQVGFPPQRSTAGIFGHAATSTAVSLLQLNTTMDFLHVKQRAE